MGAGCRGRDERPAAASAISGSADVDEDSAALDAYNTMLARLAREAGDQRQDPD